MTRASILAALTTSAAAFLGLVVAGCDSSGTNGGSKGEIKLLNVSYDPTRELWVAVNKEFIAKYEKEEGQKLSIKQSHGGSSSQARAVIDGLDADVVTLAMWPDTDAIRKVGLIKEGWEKGVPNSLPYSSTIVFVVRKGNPKGIKDWPDLVQNGVKIVTPDPKTSGNGKLSFLAAWGAALKAEGGTQEKALEFVTKLYQQVPVLDSGARAATSTFAQKKIGDVHLTWENEGHLEVLEAKGELEIVYPKVSILAEPFVAVVDANVDRKKTRAVAEAYLKFLDTPEAQEIIAQNYYRPSNKAILERHAETFPAIELFSITDVAPDWNAAIERFFSEGGVFDKIQAEGK